MDTKEVNKKECTPVVIANPIYDTVFSKLVKNPQVVEFFLSVLLEREIKDIIILPENSTCKPVYFSYEADVVVTLVNDKGRHRQFCIEFCKSWDEGDSVIRHSHPHAPHLKNVVINGITSVLPKISLHFMGNDIPKTDYPCLACINKGANLMTGEPIDISCSEFIETICHDYYIIQAGRVRDTDYTNELSKALSIFEQKYFTLEGSKLLKEYHCQPDDDDDDKMKLVIDVLSQIGADFEKRKEIIEEEEKASRASAYGAKIIRQ
jgi:hypothetical protein